VISARRDHSLVDMADEIYLHERGEMLIGWTQRELSLEIGHNSNSLRELRKVSANLRHREKGRRGEGEVGCREGGRTSSETH
jgi:hypothetical protein